MILPVTIAAVVSLLVGVVLGVIWVHQTKHVTDRHLHQLTIDTLTKKTQEADHWKEQAQGGGYYAVAVGSQPVKIPSHLRVYSPEQWYST